MGCHNRPMARIYSGDEIDDALRMRLSSHRAGLDIAECEVLAIYDRSIFGRVKAGILFTDSKLIVFDDDAQEIFYDSVQQAHWQISEQWGLVSLTLQMSNGETWTHDLGLSSKELTHLVDILAPQLPFVDEAESSLAGPAIVVQPPIPVSTTPTMGARKITAVHGPVFGQAEVSLSRHRVPSVAKELLAEARQRALDEMAQDVDALGGQAVVGLRVEHVPLDNSRLLITAVGTAVSLVKSEGPYR